MPDGATVLEPVGTAPGLVVPGSPTVLVLPGPPRELQPMWETALETEPMRELLARAGTYEQRIMRLFGIPESEIARSLREIEADGVPIEQLEITTCLRRGEIEIATVFEPPAAEVYDAFEAAIRERHADTLFSEDGSTVDDQVIELLEGRTVAVAESCTGGLMSARLTDRGGSSAYMLGGLVVYSNEAKTALAGVPAELIEAHGAVSPEVAAALADGAQRALRRAGRHRHHRHRRARRRDRGEAGRHGLPQRRGGRRRALGPHRAAAGRPPDDPRAHHDRRDARPAPDAP